MKCGEKDRNLPKYFPLKNQNQERKVKNEMGEEIEEMKCKKEKEKILKGNENNKR